MDLILENDLKEIDLILDEVKNQMVQFLEKLDRLPTHAQDQSIPTFPLPNTGLGSLRSLELFQKHFQKLIVASAGPRYWGFVTGGATPASIVGDWLTTVFDQNTQALKGSGDISAEIELETIKLLLELLNLPPEFNGGFVTGATMSNFTGLAVARQWAGAQLGKDIARDGMTGDVVVLGGSPHSSVIKCLSMLGFGSNNLLTIETLYNREAINVTALEETLNTLNGKSVILNCSAGTVNTVDFDDIQAIVKLKEKYKFWLHIDAAFGGFAACDNSYRHLLTGWEQADSITIDCHKWLNVPYDSAVILTRKEHKHLQIQSFQNSNAAYLGDSNDRFSYLNFLPENSRRFRALPVWFSLMAYGKAGFQSIVENSIQCAQTLGNLIEASGEFELTAPVRLNVVCFGLKNEKESTAEFLSKLNARGNVFMTPTVLYGKQCIRAAFVNFRTSHQDIEIAMAELNQVYSQMFKN